MSWRKPDLNPDTNIQQYQSDRLALQTKLLPNTDKTGSGIYLSPLLSADGKLQVDVNAAPAASNFTTFNQSLFDAVSVAGGHASNGTELDVSSRTGALTIYGTLTSKLAYSLALQLSLDGTNWFNSATHILLDDDLSFHIDFTTSAKKVRLKYSNNHATTVTVSAQLNSKGYG